MDFNYYLPVNLLFGRGKIQLLGKEAKKLGTHALLVTGKNSTRKSGLLNKALLLLKEEKITVTVFDKIEQNPLTTTALEGANLAKEVGSNVVIGLGGGSILDAAKAISFSINNEGDLSSYIFGEKFGPTAAPLIAVPTTCGTGSEGNCFAVLTNPDTYDKKSLRTNAIIPNVSIVDPNVMQTLPPSIFASVSFDALCHSMEAYLSRQAQPLTDQMVLYSIKLLGENILKAYETMDSQAVENVTLASTLGGMVINTAGVSAPHGLEHPVSGLYNVVHGKGLAALTPVITELSAPYQPVRYATISRFLNGQDETDCYLVIQKLLDKLHLSCNLTELGVKEKDLDWLTENAVKVSTPSIKNHPKQFSPEEIREIYKKCL